MEDLLLKTARRMSPGSDGEAPAFPKRSRPEQEAEENESDAASASSGSSSDPESADGTTAMPLGCLSPVDAEAVDDEAMPGGDGRKGGIAPCVSHGSVCLIGRRREMEDALTVALGFSPEHDFFGVYDGHGGKGVAEACRERMHVVLAGEVERMRRRGGGGPEGGNERWREVMEACFREVDGEVVGRAEAGSAAEKTVGSTAVVAVVGAERIVVANCGDSRAVLCRAGTVVPLSSDHKPNRPDELERVEAAGGRVINWDGYRVLGVLATSRSIGDQYLKPFVTSEPEVIVIDRTEKDEFLILASDGLWDVVSNETACALTRRFLSRQLAGKLPDSVRGRGATLAAAALAELAMSRGSWDNISVVVVELKRLGGKSGRRNSFANGR